MDYALDFGTSNTVIARRNLDGKVETVKVIPNLVYVENAQAGQVIIGQEINDQTERLFRNFKRAIATEIEGFVPEVDGVEVTAKLVGVWFLQNVLKHLPDISRLVLTVPVESFEQYRQWLLTNVSSLAVPEIRIIDESTAAALGYGITEGSQTVLVIDFGGGTIDFSVVRLSLDILQERSALNLLLKWANRPSFSGKKGKPTAKVLAKTGQNLGGMDIDYWILDYLITELNIPRSAVDKTTAEKLKIGLSSTKKVDFYQKDCHISLDQMQLQAILTKNDFFVRLDKCLANIQAQLQRIDLEFADLNAVIVVGGTAQMPVVRQWVATNFPSLPIYDDNPFEAVARGAIAQDWVLADFLYHSYGIRYWDRRNKCHNWHTIFSEGQTYPTPKPYELALGVSIADQPCIELVIGEIESTDTEIIYTGDQLITKALPEKIVRAYPLNDTDTGRAIAPLNPLGTVGTDRIKVLLNIDSQRTLKITVEDLLTQKVLLTDQPVVKLQ